MEWPSKRVPQGGLFHPPKVNYDPQTRDYLKALINESKLSTLQRKKDYPLRSSWPQSKSELVLKQETKTPLIRPGSSKKRCQQTIADSGAYIRDKFVPQLPRVDGERAKRHLQDIMAFGKDVQPTPRPSKAKTKAKAEVEEENRFDQLVREIQERRDFLDEMKSLGEGDKYEQIIEQQIQTKLREMKALEFL
ncbi:UPF0193 protein EVG1-like isoform X2 [Photinus pyralis]|uniref:UPF0193 protein EVG1-like isoform X2 n=1 Tax=Photinus pyralis TaxID=7054 RepID=UPI00126753ED|nr:UPF0193 protein EVG1-like isoform X2 [Photinus pyralis]